MRRGSFKDQLQTVLACIVINLPGASSTSSFHWAAYCDFSAMHRSQARAILFVLYAIIYGQIGNAIGIPYLFWNEGPITRLLAATESTLLLATDQDEMLLLAR